MASFRGRIVHLQTWPEDLALDGKKVVVIGTGATAATLIPAIADRCAHVTMLQRSLALLQQFDSVRGRLPVEGRCGAHVKPWSQRWPR
jgi:cation diffusion facilitator CzcD-associated flavoprotein CzcO